MNVLLIEDNDFNIELLTVRLEGLGCVVLVAKSPEEGVQAAIDASPDLILLDMKLDSGRLVDELEGVKVLNELRANARTAAIPVVIHSIYVRHPNEAPQAIPLADGFLQKPFRYADLKELVERVRTGTPAPGVQAPGA